MQARMKNPAVTVPGAMQAMLALGSAGKHADVPKNLLTMVHLRASQINNCGFCADRHGVCEFVSSEVSTLTPTYFLTSRLHP